MLRKQSRENDKKRSFQKLNKKRRIKLRIKKKTLLLFRFEPATSRFGASRPALSATDAYLSANTGHIFNYDNCHLISFGRKAPTQALTYWVNYFPVSLKKKLCASFSRTTSNGASTLQQHAERQTLCFHLSSATALRV